nr:fimbria/pilus periplasmic chaperone [Enterovibrio nigricans]
MRIFRSLLLALLLFSPFTQAFELLPMVSFFSDHGAKSEQFFQINNTTGLPLPLEISVKERNIVGDEEETLKDTDDFFVFPPQALIPPGKTQMVKVKYLGAPLTSRNPTVLYLASYLSKMMKSTAASKWLCCLNRWN